MNNLKDKLFDQFLVLVRKQVFKQSRGEVFEKVYWRVNEKIRERVSEQVLVPLKDTMDNYGEP